MSKKIMVELPEDPIRWMGCSGPHIEKMENTEFLNWAGGLLSTKLFEGDFRNGVIEIINAAMARGGLRYHQQLKTHAESKEREIK